MEDTTADEYTACSYVCQCVGDKICNALLLTIGKKSFAQTSNYLHLCNLHITGKNVIYSFFSISLMEICLK